MGAFGALASMKHSSGMGLIPWMIDQKRKKGVPAQQGNSPLGIAQNGNVAGGLASTQGSPLGKMLT